jgi:hypothetical protein
MGRDHDFTDDELALLRAARLDEQPSPPELKQRIFAGLGVAASITATATTTAAAAGSLVAPTIPRVLLIGVAKWAAVGVAAGTLTLGGSLALRSSPPRREAIARPVAASPAAPDARSREVVSEIDEVPSAAPTPPVATMTTPRLSNDSTPPPPTQRAGALALEVESLDRVRIALAARDGAKALGLLDAHHLAFPEGRLAPETMYMRIQALVLAGNRPAARDLAKRFLASFPTAPQASDVRTIVALPTVRP